MTTLLPGYLEQNSAPWSFAENDGVMRFEVRSGDHWAGDTTVKERSEISLLRSMSVGTPQTIQYDFKIEAGAANTSKWTIIGQLHAQEDPGEMSAGPPIDIGLQGEKMVVAVRADPNATTLVAPTPLTIFTDTADLVRDQWYHLKLDFIIDPTGGGYLKVARDGVTLVQYHGAIGYNDIGNPYWKTGIYRGPAAETMVMDVKNIDASLNIDMNGNQESTGSHNRDHMYGYGGDDSLKGLEGDDFLFGGSGNDTLYGGAGADHMAGEAGNDTYYVDSLKDKLTETASGGIDLVNSSISYKLGAHLERLTLTGEADLRADGNDLDNRLIGNTGNNVLFAGAGKDYLDGGAGADTLYGGTGNDTFVVDNAGDKVIEYSGGGIDTVLTSLAAYALGDHLENLTMTGAGGRAKGNTLDNHILGSAGNDVLEGKGGDDTLVGGWGNDTLIGGAGDDVLSGSQNGDTFVFNIGGGHDVITDFANGYGDSLDLSAWINSGHTPEMTVHTDYILISDRIGDTIQLLGAHAWQLEATATGYSQK